MKCSGAMTTKCDSIDIQQVDLGLTRLMRGVPMCAACREVAYRFGMIERRESRGGRRKGDR